MNQISEKSSKTHSKPSLKLIKKAKPLDQDGISANEKEAKFSLRLYDNNNKRFFDFNEFAALGHQFAKAIAETFILYSSSVSIETAQASHCTLSRFFRWLIANKNKHPELILALQKNYEKAEPLHWEAAVDSWREDLQAEKNISLRRKGNLIAACQTFIRNLIVRGVVPKLHLPHMPINLRNAGRPTKCLAEAIHISENKKNKKLVDVYLSESAGSSINLDIKRDFLTVLLEEKGTIAGTEQEHAKELMKVNAERLASVRECAVKDFQKWHAHWLKGQELIEKCNLSFEELPAFMQAAISEQGEQEKLILSQVDLESVLAGSLKYFHEHPEYKGQTLRRNFMRENIALYKLLTKLGSAEEFQAYLFPHPEMIVAAIVIFLCDTGANVSVGWSLSYDCLEDSNEPGYKVIKGTKMRARGKLIVNQLPVRDRQSELSCIQALETYREISFSLRAIAAPETAEKLFLYIGWSRKIQTVSNLWWVANFRRFVKRHPEISHLKINSKMIRPSVLMQATYAENSGIAAAGILADHKSVKTTDSYVNARYPLQIIWERMIREFQQLFQAVAIFPINGAAEKLGLTAEQVSTLLSEANRTGLGIACLDPLKGIQPNTVKNESCTELQNCPNCPQRFVLATVENLKDLILWNYYLKSRRDEWEKQRPERWEKVWLPWLAFTEVAIEAAGRGRTMVEFAKAKTIAKSLIDNNELNFPPLW